MSVQLWGESDEWLPERFGDCRIDWGLVDPTVDWQRQREVLSILAGPVTEMVYRDDPLHPAHFGPWKHDWEHAWKISEGLVPDSQKRSLMLEELIRGVHGLVVSDSCWPAIAALADELAAHEFLDQDQIEQTIGFWFRQSV